MKGRHPMCLSVGGSLLRATLRWPLQSCLLTPIIYTHTPTDQILDPLSLLVGGRPLPPLDLAPARLCMEAFDG